MPDKEGNEWHWQGHTFTSNEYIGRKSRPYPAGGGIYMVGKIDLWPDFPQEMRSFVASIEDDELPEEMEQLDKELAEEGQLIMAHPEGRDLAIFKPNYIGIADNFEEDVTTSHPQFNCFQFMGSNCVLTLPMVAEGRERLLADLIAKFEPACNQD